MQRSLARLRSREVYRMSRLMKRKFVWIQNANEAIRGCAAGELSEKLKAKWSLVSFQSGLLREMKET
jgi:hypothetical protein